MPHESEGPRLAIVATHPIQHFTPFYAALHESGRFRLRVFFATRVGLEAYFDEGFGKEIKWDADLLSGYESEFLPGAAVPAKMTFWNVDSPDLGEALAAFRPQAVVIYGYGARLMWRAARWCRRKGVPLLMISDSELLHRRPLPIRAAKQVAVRTFFRYVDGFLSIGDCNEDYLKHYGASPERIYRCPLPTAETPFKAVRSRRDVTRKDWRAAKGISAGRFLVLFVGKLIPRKRPQDLLDAVLSLPGDANVTALFAGDGELREALAKRIPAAQKDRAYFAGFVNQRELPNVYAASDLLVHPSEIDPHPLSTVEAALMGLPIVVSDRVGSAGPTDTVRPGMNGEVYACGDVHALAGHIRKFANDHDLVAQMGKRSVEIAEETGMSSSVAGMVRAVAAVLLDRS